MLPTAGFIPPPVVPLVPTAANAIVSTGGLLAGMGAGAAAGAKVGSLLGPSGVVAGAVVGGLLLPLLLPQPTAPGTLPGLDPGLNPTTTPKPDPDAAPVFPDGWEPELPPNLEPGTKLWVWKVRNWYNFAGESYCHNNQRINDGGQWFSDLEGGSWRESRMRIKLDEGSTTVSCGDPANNSLEYWNPWSIEKWDSVKKEWVSVRASTSQRGTAYNASRYRRGPATTKGVLEGLEVDGVPIDISEVLGAAPPNPRPLPVPIKPLPGPEPEPAQVPIPDPEPQPLPLEVPSPDTPDAPPITIPQAPPAPPQEVPGPGPDPYPLPGHGVPKPIAPPVPVPGVPTIPEPAPDPSIVPAPGPSPLPLPSPNPGPTPQPEPNPVPDVPPSPAPVPVPVPVPSPPQVVPPESPGGSTPTDPGGTLPPVQLPLPIPTPPGSHFPVPGKPPVTGGGTRADIKAIAAEVGRIEQKVARLQKGTDGIDLSDWLWLLPILEDFFEADIPGTTYDLQGVCESVESGQDQPVAEFPVAPAKNLGAIINRIDALPDVLQQHLAYRTPICHGSKKEGEFRTLSFISDEQSPNGKSRVVKRFRYRSSSGLGLPDIVNHWKDFVWQAGPVCVKHADSPWGTPQIWAASIDEGKRVIRHAAGEAGIDPDQVGRWIVGGSHNPRYGVPGTMRINTSGGYYMITARDGASERPQVVIVPPDS